MKALVIGIGNPSRGDDAIGPALVERLAGRVAPGVGLLTDFQLQVECVLDLHGRDLVVFVDAAVDAQAPFQWHEVTPAASRAVTTHAMAPSALLAAYEAHFGEPAPRALVLAVRGYAFGLGDGLSPAASANLDAAQHELEQRLRRPG